VRSEGPSQSSGSEAGTYSPTTNDAIGEIARTNDIGPMVQGPISDADTEAISSAAKFDQSNSVREGDAVRQNDRAQISDNAPELVGQIDSGEWLSESVPSTHLSKDAWTTIDSLGFDAYAVAIAAFLRNDKSEPPLTISIQAPWGGGKTSLMRMVQKELELSIPSTSTSGNSASQPWSAEGLSREESKVLQCGTTDDVASEGLTVGDLEREINEVLENTKILALPVVPVKDIKKEKVTIWFNAWMYESTNQIWAGLVDAILQQVPSRLRRKERELFWLRLNLSRIDGARVRQKIHTYFFERLVQSTIGLGRAIAAATTTAALAIFTDVVFLPEKFAGAGPRLSIPLSLFAIIFASVKIMITRSAVKQEPIAEVAKNLVEVPNYRSELGFIHQAEEDLRRVFDSLQGEKSLVIFIDDLDRCSPQKVAGVLEAVNLFLAGDFPDCYFVIGMDAELVAAALEFSHKDLSTYLPQDARTPVGWRFMDKFVQLPFVIPSSDAQAERSFVEQLLERSGLDTGDHQGEKVLLATDERFESSHSVGPATKSATMFKMADLRMAVENAGVAAHDNTEFRRLVQDNVGTFKGNPREIKRFVNLLRFNHLLWYARKLRNMSAPSMESLCRWTVMSVKWPEHVRWLKRMESRRIAQDELDDVLGPEADLLSATVTNHFAVLEAIARKPQAISRAEWNEKLTRLYGIKDDTPWLNDEQLLAFYKDTVHNLGDTGGLSGESGKGFW
jgi:KAP family P-loop domain